MKICKISVFLNKYSKMNTVWYFVRFAISNNQVTFDILGYYVPNHEWGLPVE